MNKEYIRLYKLWQDNKITSPEFRILISKIKTNTMLDMIIIWILNPFSKLSPRYAFIIGTCLILFISFIGSMTGFHFEGIPPSEAVVSSLKITFTRILSEQILGLIILSITFYILSKINNAKNLRLFDFCAFIAIAYLARAVYSIELYLLKLFIPSFFINLDHIKMQVTHFPKILNIVWTTIQWLMYIWLFRLYFVALQMASGLVKTRLWVTYIIGLIVGNTICYSISKYLLHWIS